MKRPNGMAERLTTDAYSRVRSVEQREDVGGRSLVLSRGCSLGGRGDVSDFEPAKHVVDERIPRLLGGVNGHRRRALQRVRVPIHPQIVRRDTARQRFDSRDITRAGLEGQESRRPHSRTCSPGSTRNGESSRRISKACSSSGLALRGHQISSLVTSLARPPARLRTRSRRRAPRSHPIGRTATKPIPRGP